VGLSVYFEGGMDMKIDESLHLFCDDTNEKAVVFNLKTSKQYELPYKKAKELDEYTINKINSLACAPVEIEYKKLEHLRLILTNKCNLKCIYCYADGGSYHQKLGEMDFVIVQKTIKFFYSKYKYIHQISFFGGEPLIKIDLIEQSCAYINSYCKKNEIPLPIYSMVTNATLMDDKAIEIISKYNIHINVSLDGPKEFNDTQRIFVEGNKSVFDLVDKNISKLRKKQSFSIESTCSNHIDEFGYTFKDIQDYFRNRYSISRVNVSAAIIVDKVDDRLKLSNNEYVGNSTLAMVKKFFNQKEFVFNDLIIRLLNTYFTNYYCSTFCDAGITQFSIWMNGDVYPCQLFLGKEDYKLGNIDELNDKVLNEFKNKQLKNFDKCKKCGYIRFCQTCLRRRDEIKESTEYCEDIKSAVDYFLDSLLSLKYQNKPRYELLMKGYMKFYEENQ
jgi:uncharacterized protein